jgi:hypothetical protein
MIVPVNHRGAALQERTATYSMFVAARGGSFFLSSRHFCRQAGGIDAQIHERMHDDCHSKRTHDRYQQFRVHLEVPRFGGVIDQTGLFQDLPTPYFCGFL